MMMNPALYARDLEDQYRNETDEVVRQAVAEAAYSLRLIDRETDVLIQKIELDVVTDGETLEEALATIPSDILVAADVTERTSMGWPIVEFTGTRRALRALILRWYSNGDAESARTFWEFYKLV